MTHYDYFVIGAGSGGVSSSRLAASMGAKVGIAESFRVGGTCVVRGCVPKKLFVYASHYKEDIESAAGYGWDVGTTVFNWNRLVANKDKEIDRLNSIYLNMLKNAGVTLHEGAAIFKDQKTVQVGSETITADKFLIATGGTPSLPNIKGIEHAITSNEAFHLETLPEKITIVGGGYIAVEFAGIFNGLGVETEIIYRGDAILRGFDNDVRHFLSDELKKKGITIRTETNITKIEKTDGYRVHFDDGTTSDVGKVMYCTGRNPNTEGLNLNTVGVQTDSKTGAIIVDETSQTTQENIYAVGDVTNRINLTPVAIKEGRSLATRLFSNNSVTVDYYNVPSAVFSQPSVAVVGLTEEESLKAYKVVDVYKTEFRAMKHTLGGSDERVMMKMLVDAKSDKVIGVHMVGDDAAEIIQGIAVAIKAGVTKADFDATVGIHPSSAEEFVTMREKFKTVKA